MVNWTNLIIIGALILVAVFFVLPMMSNSGSSGGNISGGMPTNPSGDVGQGGNLPSDNTNSGYVPPSTAGANTNGAPANETMFSYGDINNPSNYASFSGTGSGKLTFIGKNLLGTAGITREQLQAAGYQESKAFSGYFAPETAGGMVIAQGRNQSITIEGNGKSNTQVLAGGSSGGFNSQGKGTYKTPSAGNVITGGNPANAVPSKLPSISKGSGASKGFGGGGAGAR